MFVIFEVWFVFNISHYYNIDGSTLERKYSCMFSKSEFTDFIAFYLCISNYSSNSNLKSMN